MKDKCKDIPSKMACCNIVDIDKAGILLEGLHQIMHNMKEQ